jgi:hypothetical protein
MQKCERTNNCPFFVAREKYPVIVENYQSTLCQREFTRCARYVVFKVLGEVPEDLRPYDHETASKILNVFK